MELRGNEQTAKDGMNLDWGSGQDDATLDVDGSESLEGLRV